MYIYTEGSIDLTFFNETFLVKGTSEIFKVFFLYDEIILKWKME